MEDEEKTSEVEAAQRRGYELGRAARHGIDRALATVQTLDFVLKELKEAHEAADQEDYSGTALALTMVEDMKQGVLSGKELGEKAKV